MENKHWNKPYSKRAYDLIQGNIDKVNHANHLYEKQKKTLDTTQVKLYNRNTTPYRSNTNEIHILCEWDR